MHPTSFTRHSSHKVTNEIRDDILVSEVIELVLVVDQNCDKFGFISQEAIERTLLFEFVKESYLYRLVIPILSEL
jgi:hypothetical protein